MTSFGGPRRVVQTLLLAALPLCLGFCAAGVGDSCVLDQHCEGNVAITCEPPCAEIGCHWTSHAQDCGDSGEVCVELGERHLPLCALSKEPVARCSTQTHFCDGDKVVACSGEHAATVTDCAAQGLTCANVTPGTPECARSTQPDPRCTSGVTAYCGGSTLTSCAGGFATSGTVCQHACVEPVTGSAICALEGAKDSNCTPATSSYCAGNSKVFCTQGYAVDSWDCTTCALSPFHAQCLGPDGKELQIKPPVRARDGG